MNPELLKQVSIFIAKHEGLKLKAYLCPAGVPTIGYGDTEYLKQFKNPLEQTITKDFADELLKNRIQKDYFVLKNLLKVELNNNQLTALLSLMFNIGRSAFAESTLLKLLNNKESKEKIALQFERWNKIGKIPNAGLTKRRLEEKELFIK